jgi:His/Glu/Gln/Arg/opine family amino acid ABC transporter permease subunit
MSSGELLSFLTKTCTYLLKGALITVEVSALGIAIGLFFGTLLGVMNSKRFQMPVLSHLITGYVWVLRGTPLFVQLFIVYFAVPEALSIELSPLEAGVITLGFNSAAYLAETMRGGINSVSVGQWEAEYVLGYSTPQTFFYIIFPQALRSVLPAITNELAAIIKESSILMVIGVPELMKLSRDTVARELKPMEVYAMTALIYLLLTSVVAFWTKRLEKRMA